MLKKLGAGPETHAENLLKSLLFEQFKEKSLRLGRVWYTSTVWKWASSIQRI